MAASHGPGRSPDRTAKVATTVIGLLILAAAVWALERLSSHPGITMVAITVVAALVIAAAALWGTAYLEVVQAIVRWGTQALATVWAWVVRLFRSRVKGVPVAVLLVLALVGAVGGPLAWRAVRGGPALARGCPHPAELRVLASADGLEPTREVARRYERWTASRGQDSSGCSTVHVFVYAALTPAAATSALAAGWRDGGQQQPLVSVGPRPDVWLPDSTVDVREVRDLARRAQLPAPVRASSSIGSSPVVLVTRAPLSGAVPVAPTWHLLTAVRSGSQPALLAADPKTSSTGLLAASGYLSDSPGGQVPPAEARARVRAVVVAGTGTGAALLCQWGSAAGTTAPESVIVSDQAWRRFVAGDPPGGDCPGGQVPPGGTRMLPVGAPVLDHPFVELTWSTDAQRAVVNEFHDWLTGTDGRDALAAVGLGPPRPGCSGLDGNACVPSDLEATLDLYLTAQKPGQVLLALDASGSMAERVGPAGTTRFGIASQAVSQALGQMGPKDQFGLWTFPGPDGRGHRQLVAIAEGDARHREKAGKALRGVSPAGGTPLYDTVLAGMRAVPASDAEAGPRALVVLTDGQDTTSSRSAGAVRQEVRNIARVTGVRLLLIATGDASCTGSHGLRDLAAAGLGECLDVDPDQIDAAVAQLFDSLWKGQ